MNKIQAKERKSKRKKKIREKEWKYEQLQHNEKKTQPSSVIICC